jgi:hypothetical protein
MTLHNQTKVQTIWFLNLPRDEYIDNKKAQSLNFDSKAHEAYLEDQRLRKKSSRWSSRRRKNCKANKRHEKRQTKPKWQRRAQKSSKLQKKLTKLPLTISMQALPLR